MSGKLINFIDYMHLYSDQCALSEMEKCTFTLDLAMQKQAEISMFKICTNEGLLFRREMLRRRSTWFALSWHLGRYSVILLVLHLSLVKVYLISVS